MNIHLNSDDLNVDLPPDLVFPSCPSKSSQNNGWIFWRVYSTQIYSTLERHVNRFKGTYLSRVHLANMFYTKINDENADYDSTMEFQAVQIVKIHDPFMNRLTMDAMVVATADNLDVSQAERTRKIYAVDSLAELLKDVLEEQDYMLIFSQNSLVSCETIALNSRMQELVLIAVYRHNGVFCPEYEGNSDNIIIRFDGDKFRHLVQEQEDDECLMKIEPRSTRPVAIVLPVVLNGRQETSNDKVMRFLDNVSPQAGIQEQNRDDCSGRTSPLINGDNNPKPVFSKETASEMADFIGDYDVAVIQCFDSDSDSSSPNMDCDDPPTSKSPQSLAGHDENELNGSGNGSSIAQKNNHNTIRLSNQQRNATKSQNVPATRRSSPTIHLQQVVMVDEVIQEQQVRVADEVIQEQQVTVADEVIPEQQVTVVDEVIQEQQVTETDEVIPEQQVTVTDEVIQEQQQNEQNSENENNSFAKIMDGIYVELFAVVEQEQERAELQKRKLTLAPQESDNQVQHVGSPKENHVSKGHNSTGSMCSQEDSLSKLTLEKNSSHNHEVENVPPSPTHQSSNPFLNMNDATQIHYSLDTSTWSQ